MYLKKTALFVIFPLALLAAFALGSIYRGNFTVSEKGELESQGLKLDSHEGHDHAGEETDDHLSEKRLDWCFEHRIPESECTSCHPNLAADFKAKNNWCVEHGIPESHCRLCNPGLQFSQELALNNEAHISQEMSIFFPENKVECSTSESVIKFASAATADRAGLTTEPALESSMPPEIDAPAEIKLNAAKTVIVTSTVAVNLIRWMVEPGDKITAGMPIAMVSSPEIADLKARLIEFAAELSSVEKDYTRKATLKERRLISDAEWVDIEASLNTIKAKFESTRGLLISAGLSEADLDSINMERSVSPIILLRASVDGILVEREAPLGELIEAGIPLAVISDPHSLWIEARVGERDIWRIKAGQAIEFSSDGSSLHRTSGEIIWVAQFLDEATRTGIVRARLNSSEARLRAGEFGRMIIQLDEVSKSVLVSKDAVQWEGCCNVVFVKESADQFRPRKIRIAKGDDSHYRVIAGLDGGELIVVNGSYLLKTELKKSSIGAGCCGLDAGA